MAVEKQLKREIKGRNLRPLLCDNTAWMGGVDWATIEAKALVRGALSVLAEPPQH